MPMRLKDRSRTDAHSQLNMAASYEQQRPQPLLRVPDVMEWLGISQSAVYRLVDRRLVRFYKTRSGLRFDQTDICEYLQSCRIEAINEHEYGGTKN